MEKPQNNDPIMRMTNCMVRLQDQLERMAQMQSETALTVGKLSQAVLRLSHEVSDVKARLVSAESSFSTRESEMNLGRHFASTLFSSTSLFENPPLTPSIDPASLAGEVGESLGPFIPRKSRVLVVEDDVAYQWLVSKHLEAKGVDCVLASTAQDALNRVRNGTFDLILMDIQLPGGINGLDTAQRIRAFDSNTPIVSMTSAITPRQVASYLAGGMNDVLPKPFSRDGLLGLVSRFCVLNIGGQGTKGTIQEITVDGQLEPGKVTNKATFIFGPHI